MGIRRVLRTPIIKLFIITCIATFTIAEPDYNEAPSECKYTIHIKTGSHDNAGSDSVMSLSLFAFDHNDQYGHANLVQIDNLQEWGGHMSRRHNYYESGKLDVFSGTGVCLGGPACSMTLVSDGTGEQPAWYVEYVTVSANFWTANFTMGQWLSTDFPPYQLNVTVYKCPVF